MNPAPPPVLFLGDWAGAAFRRLPVAGGASDLHTPPKAPQVGLEDGRVRGFGGGGYLLFPRQASVSVFSSRERRGGWGDPPGNAGVRQRAGLSWASGAGRQGGAAAGVSPLPPPFPLADEPWTDAGCPTPEPNSFWTSFLSSGTPPHTPPCHLGWGETPGSLAARALQCLTSFRSPPPLPPRLHFLRMLGPDALSLCILEE